MAVSLDKIQTEAPALVKLAQKAQFGLSKHGLDGHQAKVALCLDHSGSMRPFYRKGIVQRLAERVLALATQLDDDGAIDVFLFDSSAFYAGEVRLSDHEGSVDRLRSGRRMGTTDYAGAMRLVREHFAGETLPVYVVFLTDGSPDNRTLAKQELLAASERNVFYKFLGIGEGPFDFLRRLDDLKGRPVDNAHFIESDDIESVGDQQFFDLLLIEYPAWLDAARRAGLLA